MMAMVQAIKYTALRCICQKNKFVLDGSERTTEEKCIKISLFPFDFLLTSYQFNLNFFTQVFFFNFIKIEHARLRRLHHISPIFMRYTYIANVSMDQAPLINVKIIKEN